MKFDKFMKLHSDGSEHPLALWLEDVSTTDDERDEFLSTLDWSTALPIKIGEIVVASDISR